MQPNEVLLKCAEVLRRLGFNKVSVEGVVLYYEDKPLVQWIQRIDEDEVENYGAFVIASPYEDIGIEESEGHEVPEDAEGVEDIIITECIISILDSEVIQNIPSIYHYDGEKVRIGFPYPSRIEIEVP
ncbi:MAG: hypothetical protein RQ862_11465 [Candidatus Caldarchaeales archaeon]|nr:hypothetical protein [Candidatus Caldarchaeales archaeon]